MFGFLAAFGPAGIAAAVVGTIGAAAYGAMKDDDYEPTTCSNKSEREEQARSQAKKEKKDNITNEIEGYKTSQIKRLKKKYGIDLLFNNSLKTASISAVIFPSIFGQSGLSIAKNILGNDDHISLKLKKEEGTTKSVTNEVDTLLYLENETKEIEKLIENMETLRNESIA